MLQSDIPDNLVRLTELANEGRRARLIAAFCFSLAALIAGCWLIYVGATNAGYVALGSAALVMVIAASKTVRVKHVPSEREAKNTPPIPSSRRTPALVFVKPDVKGEK